ncbi:MAG: N-acetylmuramic acid 6-phosphate etherase [Marinifilaceae bacterium]
MNITESSSEFDNLDRMSTKELLNGLNQENQKVQSAVAKVLPRIEELVQICFEKLKQGGRIFYIGAGTSGRLGVLDASELPPTFGISRDIVIGIIAGGDRALRHAIEAAEDNPEQAWKDLQKWNISSQDTVIGLSASGKTPYVIGGLHHARREGIFTACITSNPHSPLSQESHVVIEAIVGPEFVSGSTRLKSGTALKLILNMISTSLMIKLGRVWGNQMVDMKITNSKLKHRGIRILMKQLNISRTNAEQLLHKHGSVRSVLKNQKKIQ